MAEVVWSDAALANLDAIEAYIRQFSPLAAQRMAQRLLMAAWGLEQAPERGRSITRNRRELTIIPPYLIRYRIDGEQVVILEVRHAARRSTGGSLRESDVTFEPFQFGDMLGPTIGWQEAPPTSFTSA